MSRSKNAARVTAIVVAGLFTLVGVVPSATATTTAVAKAIPAKNNGDGWCC